jgi:AcrR family transcriptional regulator
MATVMTDSAPQPRIPLTRDRVLRAAVGIADEQGIAALTMRRLGEVVGAEAMSLYHHVSNKEDVLDGIAEHVVQEINDDVARLESRQDWKHAVRERILHARQILLKHPWAPGVFETRKAVIPAVLRYHDGLIGLMRSGGLSNDLCHHALHALGSRALGFSQELFDAGGGDDAEPPPNLEELPNLAGMLMEVVHDDPDSTIGWCDDQFEFEFGLDLILDGLDKIK